MSKKELTSQDELEILLSNYLENLIQLPNPELEVRFGTRGIRPISRNDYDNVIQKFLSLGFKLSYERYSLRIQNEYIDKNTGKSRYSNIRTEIDGLANIQEYCKTNSIDERVPTIYFVQKQNFKSQDSMQYPVNFDDWNFRVSFQTENELTTSSPLVRTLLDKWKDSKKIFRFINRVALTHLSYPLSVEISIVKESNRRGRNLIGEYNIQDSNVFHNPEKYEIEIEVNKDDVGIGSPLFNSIESLDKIIKKTVKHVSCGLQQTNYPVSYKEQKNVLYDYLKLVQRDEYHENQRVYPKHFIGPSSYTLQINNIAPINEDNNIPNIRENYTVTEKADGLRKMLYISTQGKLYLIDTNMNVQFTGVKTKQEHLFNSLLDGEHILHNKNGEYINLFASFDIYFINGKDVRSYTFLPISEEELSMREQDKGKIDFRFYILTKLIGELKPQSVIKGKAAPLDIKSKNFQTTFGGKSIFVGCAAILDQVNKGLFDYETDGLIFTPMDMGVGMNKPNDYLKPYKVTWEHSFKWKPSEFNTIDFLVTTQKTSNGEDHIGNIFQDGTNASSSVQLSQYKTLVLRVGFDEKKHGYINPCADIIHNNLHSIDDIENTRGYKPMPFYPTNPYDPEANICNILLREDMTGNKKIFTLDDEVIEDNTIVEFRYDIDAEKHWRWKPLKVRYDKTAEFRRGLKNFGNAYHVANSNWHSIHNPITEEMISTGENIPDELADDDVYYNKVTGTTKTRALRDFHNLFVKKLLLMKVSKPGDILVDYAAGKGGDIPKWIASKLAFVLGVDIAKDNIENRLDGACARFLNYRKNFNIMPYCLFLHGNSSVNIKNTTALYSERAKQIVNAVFGEGPKDKELLGEGVYKMYGKAYEGFNISSIQFAIHYMFESQNTLQNFLRNVSECTKLGGYFICTSYDGKTMFNKLKKKKQGEELAIMDEGDKIWSVTKNYDRKDFEENSSCVGFAIDVYQESINKTFREYLVNYNYLNQIMEDYGFVLLKREEYKELQLPSSSGMFESLYKYMENEMKRNKGKKNEYGLAMDMTANEKTISFLNRFAIYKKVRTVDAEKVSLTLMNKTVEEEEEEMKESKEVEKIVEEETLKIKPKKSTKLKKKLRLREDRD